MHIGKDMSSAIAVWSILYYMSVGLEEISLLFSASIHLLTSYRLILPTTRRGMLKFLTITRGLFLYLVGSGSFTLCIGQLFYLVHAH